MNAVTIRLDKLNKIFRTRHRDIHALSDVDLTVGQGEFVSLVGPSGCGKSTILRMLANIVRPTSGRISINGVELSSRSRWPESLIRSLGLVFHAPRELGRVGPGMILQPEAAEQIVETSLQASVPHPEYAQR